MTYVRWNSLLEGRFEKCFYIPKEDEEGEYFVEGQYINRRGIYKDTYKASEAWADYQLRPNACVALAVAPELFDRVSPTHQPFIHIAPSLFRMQILLSVYLSFFLVVYLH